MKPQRIAIITACVRSSAPSLPMMFFMRAFKTLHHGFKALCLAVVLREKHTTARKKMQEKQAQASVT